MNRNEYMRAYRKTDKHKQWFIDNKEKRIEYNKKYTVAYYIRNKEKIDLKNKLYAQANRDKIVKTVQRYVSRNKEKVSKYNSIFGKSLEGKYRLLKYRHNKRFKTDTLLSLDDFNLISKNLCTYCGDSSNYGLDRIDNFIGYTKENSTPCCQICNFMKRKSSVNDFLAHIRKINNFNKKL